MTYSRKNKIKLNSIGTLGQPPSGLVGQGQRAGIKTSAHSAPSAAAAPSPAPSLAPSLAPNAPSEHYCKGDWHEARLPAVASPSAGEALRVLGLGLGQAPEQAPYATSTKLKPK